MAGGVLIIIAVFATLSGHAFAATEEGGEEHGGGITFTPGRITVSERDYSAYCVRREWDRLQTWHHGDTVKQCYRLGNPQYYPDRVYDRMLAHCETLEEYECSFTSGSQLYEDQQTRLEESKRAYKERYKKAYTKCQAAKDRQRACINKLSWWARGGQKAYKACPLDDKSCLAPVLSEMRSWGPGAYRESEFCIRKKR